MAGSSGEAKTNVAVEAAFGTASSANYDIIRDNILTTYIQASLRYANKVDKDVTKCRKKTPDLLNHVFCSIDSFLFSIVFRILATQSELWVSFQHRVSTGSTKARATRSAVV